MEPWLTFWSRRPVSAGTLPTYPLVHTRTTKTHPYPLTYLPPESSRREHLSLKDTVQQIGRDVLNLHDSESRVVRATRNCDSAILDIKAAQSAASTVASETSAAIVALRTELASRCGAADQRARNAEQAVADAQRENAELRSRLDSLRHEQERRCDSIDAAIDRVLAVQRESQAAVATSLSVLSSSFDRCNRDISALSAQLGDLAVSLDSQRAQSADADTALAKDVSMLNDISSAMRAQQAADSSALVARIKATADAAREAIRQEAEERERRLSGLARKASSDADDLRRGVLGAEAGVQRSKASLEEHERVVLSESRTLGAQVAGLEAAVHSQATETGRRVEDLSRQHGARLDALANAVHAFANVLNLGHVVVDPKAILTRATSALRSASPERSMLGQSAAGTSSRQHHTRENQTQRLGSSMSNDFAHIAGASSRFGSPASRNLF
jgi:hypothetical protein